jgi:hypothetical protein
METSTSYINLEYIFSRIIDALLAIRDFIIGGASLDTGTAGGFSLVTILSYWKIVGTILSLLLLAGIIYSVIRKKEIEKEGQHYYDTYFVTHVAEPQRNVRWEKVEQLFASPNSSDWRLAIIEADAMLDELIISLGYPGANLGERLKGIQRGDFPTLNEAWEAHKVRNRIAHEGMNFVMTDRDARQVKMNYETVFRDAQYI